MLRNRRLRARHVGAAASTALVVVALAGLPTDANAATNATTVLAGLTKPAGGVWLPGPAGTPGHYWTPDNVLGFCRVVTAGAGFATDRCNGTAKAGGQAVYDAANQKVYVADESTKSVQVIRYDYSPAQENISNGLAIQVPNLTAVGGGTSGGRAASVALAADGSALFVGYIKSGDVMKVASPATLRAGVAPVVSKVGNTSDGRGSSGGFAMVNRTDAAGVKHADLYLGEIGGFGMSVIPDITGTGGRPACSATALCNATTVTDGSGAVVSTFPSGLATDGSTLYIGDSPPNLSAQVLAFDLSRKTASLYSKTVPTYTSGFDNQVRTTYSSITGLGLGANGDVYVGDDPTATLAAVTNAQAHLWRVPFTAAAPTVTGVAPSTGPTTGGTAVTVTGTDLNTGGTPSIKFGPAAGTNVNCASAASCTVTSPVVAGAGAVHVVVTNGGGQSSATSAADVFTYTTPPPPTAVTVSAIAPSSGMDAGGTTVKITGTNLTDAANPTTVSFGPNAASNVNCASSTSCTAVSPAGVGTVDVQVTVGGSTSPATSADRFTYVSPVADLQGYGITAPKGGIVFLPNASGGGHWWTADHAQGFCRLDAVPGAKLIAINSAVCDPGFTIGSPGQATYDPRAIADGTHYVYIPDNAVRSPGVWRLTFDPATETVSSPTAMAPGLMDNLKTNSTALSPDGTALYVGDLVDGNIRRINGIGGDPRSQTVDVVAVTQAQKAGGASRGINGTMAMIGNDLFLPENNAATYVDVSQACAAVGTVTPCPTIALNFLTNPAPVFVAGIATDQARNLVYISSSPGGANATIFRFDATTITAANPAGSPGVVYVTQGNVPAAGSAEATVWCTTTCTRPADPSLTPGGVTGFQFAQGITVDSRNGALMVTEDATAGARTGRGHIWRVPFTA